MSEGQEAEDPQEERDCTDKGPGWGQAFSPLARSREPGPGGGAR